jgi:uncharacterized protein (DUF1697 family)
MRYIALLRAINVGSHTVKMDHLRSLFEAAGAKDVETFIASGNVIFMSKSSEAALEKKLQSHLAKELGYGVAVFLRTPSELAKAAAHDDVKGSLYVGFLHAAATAAAKKNLKALETDIDTFEIKGRDFYWLCATSMGQTKLTGAKVEKALGAPTTLRNITTVRKLAEKYRED